MKHKKFAALLLCAALAAGTLASGCSGKEAAEPDAPAQEESGAAAGTAAALGSLRSFSATTLDGGSFTQDDIAARDVTVINFWALTCPPCIAEMPDLAAFAGALPDTVQVATVCLDGLGSEETVQKILEKAGFTGATLLTGDGDLAALCGNLMYTPTTVFVNSKGELVGDAVIGGQRDLAGTYLAAVNAVLAADGKAEISLAE